VIMAYEYEELLTKKFNEEYRAGRKPNLDLFNELKEVYAKAKALDEIMNIDENYTKKHGYTPCVEEYAEDVENIIDRYKED